MNDIFVAYKQRKEILWQAKNVIQVKLEQLDENIKGIAQQIFLDAWKEKFPNHIPEIIESANEIYFYNVEGFLFLKDGWCFREEDDYKNCGIRCAGPFPFEDLKEFIEKITSDNPGLVISMHFAEEITNESEIVSFSCIKFRHKDAELIEKGEILYKGWECNDKYFIIKTNGEQLAYYSTDGLGGNFKVAKFGTPEYYDFELIKEKGKL